MSQAPRGKHDPYRERREGNQARATLSGHPHWRDWAWSLEPEAGDPGSWNAVRLGISRANGGRLLEMGISALTLGSWG